MMNNNVHSGSGEDLMLSRYKTDALRSQLRQYRQDLEDRQKRLNHLTGVMSPDEIAHATAARPVPLLEHTKATFREALLRQAMTEMETCKARIAAMQGLIHASDRDNLRVSVSDLRTHMQENAPDVDTSEGIAYVRIKVHQWEEEQRAQEYAAEDIADVLPYNRRNEPPPSRRHRGHRRLGGGA